MKKPQLIQELEKELNNPFTLVKFSELQGYKYEKIAEYSSDENGNLIGICITKFKLKEIPNAIIQQTKHLQCLISLKLNRNELGNITPLSGLTNLKELDLGDNQISDISPLSSLINIKELSLSKNLISDIAPLVGLANLQELNLNTNQISNIFPLSGLQYLQELALIENKITDITPLIELTKLQVLNLSNNHIIDFSPIKDLIYLSDLWLYNTGFQNYELIKNLDKLKYLGLGKNNISEISFLKTFHSLQRLQLTENQISDITPLTSLKNLQEVDLNNNHISDISPLKGLNKLEDLSIQENPIKILPEWICNYPNLDIQWDRYGFNKGFITFYENPIENIPIEIIKQGKNAISNYFKQIKEQGGSEILYEAKVLILGEGGSGKTTLFKKIENPDLLLPQTDSTLGVEIKEGISMKHPKDEDTMITSNIWDFGGQEIQYQLHQYFITPDALYILVADNRKQQTRWDYWMQIIRLLGGKCPVLVVLNNNKTITTTSDFQIDKCKDNFPGLDIEQVKVDFSVNNHEWTFLQEKIKEKIAYLPLVNKAVPRLWKTLREKLKDEKKKANYISITRYFEICNEIKLTNETDSLQALDYFDKIGLVKHFPHDENLKDIIFLNPNWITQGLYAALDKKNKEIENGCFTNKWINQYWKNHKNRYSYTDRTYLMRLMLKDNFDICYRLNENRFIVPMLLPNIQPTYQWDINHNLQFRYQYPFMPEGVINRLIVRMNEYIVDGKIWRNGTVFRDKTSGCIAEVIQKKDPTTGLKYIGIRIKGNNLNDRKEFFTKFRNEIDHIHSTAFTKINFSEMVICNCTVCQESKTSHFYKLETLKNYILKNKTEITCDTSVEPVSISELIGTVYPAKEIEKIRNTTEYDRNSKIEISVVSSDGKLDKILENTENLKSGQAEIKYKLDTHYNYLVQLPLLKNYLKNIQIETKNLIVELNNNMKGGFEEIFLQLCDYIEVNIDNLNAKQLAAYNDLKKTESPWQTKIKIGIPLISLIGLNIESEFKLNGLIKRILGKKKKH